MRIATWNVNSIRARRERVLAVLQHHEIDVLAMQETKCKAEQFPRADFEAAGYEVAVAGINQWNGVAIASRVGLDQVRIGFPGQPGFAKEANAVPVLEPRAIGARVGGKIGRGDGEAAGREAAGVELWSVYVPNGRAVGDPHYHYKLDFLRALRDYAAGLRFSGGAVAESGLLRGSGTNPQAFGVASPQASAPPSPQNGFAAASRLLLAGDWNVIPTDADVWDPQLFASELYATDAERAAFAAFEQVEMREVTRPLVTNYTFWDYKQLRFPRNEGMRIDYMYASAALADRARAAQIDRDERKGKGASDHVPVIVDFEL